MFHIVVSKYKSKLFKGTGIFSYSKVSMYTSVLAAFLFIASGCKTDELSVTSSPESSEVFVVSQSIAR